MNNLTFESFNLKEEIIRGIYGYGYELPSSIQEKSIPIILSKKDIIAQSNSGTGKTSSFIIPSLNLIDTSIKGIQAIVISPTRELAIQTSNVINNLKKFTKINSSLCIGGTNLQQNKREVKNSHIVSCTLGRLVGFLQNKDIDLTHLKLLVLDEADEMLASDFIFQLREFITDYINTTVQIALFSATFPLELKALTKNFMNDPVEILLEPENVTLNGIKQFYINVERPENKFSTLCDLYLSLSIAQAIIYTNSKRNVEVLYDKLTKLEYPVSMIHGEMTQTDRSSIMSSFRGGDTRILITTDLLARGIDVQQVSLVINYDMPKNKECYIHRIGRSGRYGRKGTCINLITTREIFDIKDLMESYSTVISELPADLSNLLD